MLAEALSLSILNEKELMFTQNNGALSLGAQKSVFGKSENDILT